MPVVPSPSAPTWQNWSGNLVHGPASPGAKYYYTPTSLKELQSALADAAKVKGATLRVSGQRHSQSPLVAEDSRGAAPHPAGIFVVDMSCYRDLGPNHDQYIVLGPGENQVTVNTGVREDEVDAFLTQHNLMLRTVTAGGFFSLGGMTAVDVHGGTVNEKIFAETVSAFTMLLADGSLKTINAQSPHWKAPDGKDWSPLQFARVSLGGLGIVTSVTIDVLPRPYATTLRGGYETLVVKTKSDFLTAFEPMLTKHARVEAFFTPYANIPSVAWMNNPSFLVLWWDVDSHPAQPTPNRPPQPYPANACALAGQPKPEFGAPDLTAAPLAVSISTAAQYATNWLPAGGIVGLGAFSEIKKQAEAADKSHSELWLAASARCIFMSYFIPLPKLNPAGLEKVWEGLDVVSRIVVVDGHFHIAAPMEFRVVKGGDSAMSGAYCEDPDTWFINLDLIGWVDAYDLQKSSDYRPELLQFFAQVEREWVRMGGFPHHGKMYGFYDPTAAPGTHSQTGPFNPNFLKNLRDRRGGRLRAFKAYCNGLDPNGLFCNAFLRNLLEP